MIRNEREFELRCMKELAAKRVVLDVGGGARFQKGMEQYKPLFAACDYKTLDVSADYGPDIVGDIHAIPLADGSVNGVICRSVLEHVERPIDAVKEIHRILAADGVAYVQIPSTYPYHARKGEGAYPDYWRFFEETVRLMFRDFTTVECVKMGGWFRAMAFFMPMQARLRWMWEPCADALDRVFRTERKTTTAMWLVRAVK